MKVVAISILSPHHQAVLAAVHQTWPLACVLQPVWPEHAKDANRYAKLMKSPAKTIARRLKSGFDNWQAGRRDRSIAQVLDHATSEAAFDVPHRTVPNTQINSSETADWLRELEPDVIITSGCPLSKPRIFGIARLATINVHWGIAPEYRGENTLFWPLYFGDYDNIGVTIHQIDAGIDTGPILAHGFPELSPGDNEVTLLAKSARLAASLLAEVLAVVAQTQAIDGLIPQHRGRLFCDRDRTPRLEMAYWLGWKLGRRSIPLTSVRQILCVGGQTCDDDIMHAQEQIGELIDS